MHKELQITYKHGRPYGIRDESGYLFFFTEVSKFPGQEERYRQEVFEQYALADYLLSALKARSNTASTPTSGDGSFTGAYILPEGMPVPEVHLVPPTCG